MSFMQKYMNKKKKNFHIAMYKAKRSKTCYLFLLPYAVIFTLFYIVPVVMSICLSFTYYNVLETPRFVGLSNYIDLFLADDVFLTSVTNTFAIAAITGPLGYLASFLFAWFINELPRYIRAFAVLIFYAPTISGQVYLIWAIMFSGDAYGYVNSFLMKLGFINAPILWLTDPKYMMPVILLVILWMSLGTGFLSFVAGLQGVDQSQYEAGYVDGIKNRWQELWYITLPSMKPQLMFGAVMQITQSFAVADISINLAGNPSVNYSGATIVTHLMDYGSGTRYEMGYACAIATILFALMVGTNQVIQKVLRRVGE